MKIYSQTKKFSKAREDFVTTVNLCKEVYENRVPDSIAHYRSFGIDSTLVKDLTLEFYSSVDLIRSFDIQYPVGEGKGLHFVS